MDKLTQDLQTSAATAYLDVAPNAIRKWAAPGYRVFKREDLKWFWEELQDFNSQEIERFN